MRRALALAALALALGCQGPAATIVESPLGGKPRFAPLLPDTLDLAAAELAEAALSGEASRVETAREALLRAEDEIRGEGEASGLLPFGLEAAAAVLAPGREGLAATKALLERRDLEPPLRERLERELAADPLVLARDRLFEARYASFALMFNAVSAPVGRSLLNPTQLPYTLSYSVARAVVDSADGDALDLRRRQVLVYWQDFALRHPDAPEVSELAPRIEAYRDKWERTRAEIALERAQDALDAGRVPAALLYAQRSLRHRDSDKAREVREEAEQRIAAEQRARDRSLGFESGSGTLLARGEAEAVTAALAGAALPPAEDVDPSLAAPLAFLHDTTRGDSAMSEQLERLADDDDSPMARHAGAELADPLRHPERAYYRARSSERWRTARWVVLGPLVSAPDRGGLGATRYLLDLPLRLQALLLMPIRALELTWRKPTPGHAQAAAHARRYLGLYPEGSEAEPLRDWLLGHEKRRKNWMGVLRLAETAPDPDPEELEKLKERAAEQGLSVAQAEKRRDLRYALLTDVARRFRDTEAGRKAGLAAREEAFENTPHEIVFSRGFLLENPEIAGPQGFDISSALLDDDPRNGELHPDGVALTGGREARVSLLAASGDDDDPPVQIYAMLSAERLSRLVARVEETRFRKALLDRDEALVPDPQRDAVFERARLGLADSVDTRPGAEARHTYLGLRERYGMVRGRDSILPVELVVQGSLSDLSLGAFPRLIPPRPSADAELYRD